MTLCLRRFLLLSLGAVSILVGQTPADPNKSPYPHDMIWFNPPKNPQPG